MQPFSCGGSIEQSSLSISSCVQGRALYTEVTLSVMASHTQDVSDATTSKAGVPKSGSSRMRNLELIKAHA